MCKGGGGTQTATTTSQPPQAVTDAYKYITTQAEQAAGQPLQQYSGPLLAGFSPLQNSGFSGLQNAQNIANPYYNSASGLINQGTQDIWGQTPQFNQQNLQQYMNPYNQDVINATMAQINQQNQVQQGQLQGNAIASGAWGGDRAGVAQSALAGQQAMAANSTLAGLNNQNYQQAQNQFNTQQAAQLGTLTNQAGLALQGAGLQGYLGQSALQSQLGATGAQLQAGQQQQNLQQNALNIPYQQFLQQQAYPFQTTQFLANTLLGTAGTQGGTSTSSQPMQDNTASQVLGLGLGVAGLFSDKRVKDDIKRVGKTDDGQPIYTFRYKGDNTTHMGLLAQEVEKKHPDAVGNIGGIKTVNYDKATGYASGGGVPDVSVNFVPVGQYGGYGSMGSGIPAPPQIQQPQNQTMQDILGPLSMENSLGNLKGGFQSMMGNNALGAAGFSADPIKNDYNSYMNMYNSLPSFDDGGAVVNLPQGSGTVSTAMPVQAHETANFNPIVAGTPVYSFAPPGGKDNNNGFSSTIYDVNHPNPANAPAVSSAPTSTGLSQSAFTALLGAEPSLGSLFGLTPFQQHAVSINPGVSNLAYKNYQSNVGKYGFSRGGDSSLPDDSDTSPFYIAALGDSVGPPDVSVSPLNPGMSLPTGMPTTDRMPFNPIMGPPAPTGNTGYPPQPSAMMNPASPFPAAPSLSGADSTSPTIDTTLGKVDPGLALSAAGFAMASGHSRNFLQNVGEGASAGLQNYMTQKKDALTAQQKAEQLAAYLDKASAGNWQLGSVDNPDGTKSAVAFNSKTAETKPLEQNITLQGKGGAGHQAAALQVADRLTEAAKRGDTAEYNRILTAAKSLNKNEQIGDDFTTIEPKKGSGVTEGAMPPTAIKILADNKLPTEMHVLDKEENKANEKAYAASSQAWDSSLQTKATMQMAAPSISKAYFGSLAEPRAKAMALLANVIGVNPSEAAIATNELAKMSNAITIAGVGQHTARLGIGMEQFFKNSTINPENTPQANAFIFDNTMKMSDILQQNKNLISFTKALNARQQSAVEDEFYKAYPPMLPVDSKQAGGQKNVYEVNPAYNDPQLVNKWLNGSQKSSQGLVLVIHPNGTKGQIPAENLDRALAAGYQRAQ